MKTSQINFCSINNREIFCFDRASRIASKTLLFQPIKSYVLKSPQKEDISTKLKLCASHPMIIVVITGGRRKLHVRNDSEFLRANRLPKGAWRDVWGQIWQVMVTTW